MSRTDHEILNAYLDGELPADEVARVEGRLRDEPEFRQLHEELSSARSGLKILPSFRLGPDFASRVMRTAIEAKSAASEVTSTAMCEEDTPRSKEVVTPPSSFLRYRRWAGWSVAAAAALAAIIIYSHRDPLIHDANHREVAKQTDGDRIAHVRIDNDRVDSDRVEGEKQLEQGDPPRVAEKLATAKADLKATPAESSNLLVVNIEMTEEAEKLGLLSQFLSVAPPELENRSLLEKQGSPEQHRSDAKRDEPANDATGELGKVAVPSTANSSFAAQKLNGEKPSFANQASTPNENKGVEPQASLKKFTAQNENRAASDVAKTQPLKVLRVASAADVRVFEVEAEKATLDSLIANLNSQANYFASVQVTGGGQPLVPRDKELAARGGAAVVAGGAGGAKAQPSLDLVAEDARSETFDGQGGPRGEAAPTARRPAASPAVPSSAAASPAVPSPASPAKPLRQREIVPSKDDAIAKEPGAGVAPAAPGASTPLAPVRALLVFRVIPSLEKSAPAVGKPADLVPPPSP